MQKTRVNPSDCKTCQFYDPARQRLLILTHLRRVSLHRSDLAQHATSSTLAHAQFPSDAIHRLPFSCRTRPLLACSHTSVGFAENLYERFSQEKAIIIGPDCAP